MHFCHAEKINGVLIAIYIDSVMGVYKNSLHIHFLCVICRDGCIWLYYGFVFG